MRQLDATSGPVGGIFADKATAGRALGALRTAGFYATYLAREDQDAMRPKTSTSHSHPPLLLGGAIGGAGAVLAEATILAVPAAVPTILGGTLIAATIGGAAGAAVAALAPLAGLVQPQEPDLMSELLGGRSAVTVAARDRLQRERARGIMRQQGAIRIVDMEDDEEVAFATPFEAAAPRLRIHCEERFGPGRWDAYMPAYLFGWDRANRPDLDETGWNDAQARLREDWSRRHPERPWSEVEEAVIAGWEKARSLALPA